MAETAEQLMIRMGFDAMQVKLGLAKMQADNESAAVKVTAIWKKAETDRRMMTVAEVEKTEASITAIEVEEATRRNRARYLLRQRGLKQEATLAAEQAAANVSIAGGSIPANMAGGMGRKEAIAGAEGAVAGMVGFRALHNGIRAVEGMLIGSWNRVAMAAVRIAVGIGLTAATIITGIPILVAAVIAKLVMGHSISAMNEASKTSDESNKSVGESRKIVAKRHAEWLAEKAKAEKKVQDEKDKLDVEHGKLVEKLNTVEVSGQWKLNSMLIQRHTLLNQMGFLEKDSVEYKKKQLEVDAANLEIQKQQKDVAREKSEIEKSIHEKKLEITKVTEEINKIDQASPTLEMLAGDKYTSQLDKDYGSGGKWNVADGSGPLGQAARDAELYAKQQMWDLTHGNYNQAEKDRQNQIKAENLLSAAHYETPAMKQAALQKGIDGINVNIAELLTRAKTDGIVIADKQ